MNFFRMKNNGAVVSESQYRALYPDAALPAVLMPLDADPILNSPQPTVTSIQYVVGTTPVLDGLGNWVQGWQIMSYSAEQIAAQLEEKRKASLTQINNDDNRIYADVIGNKTTEYLDAAVEAKAYKTAGYPAGVDNDYGLVKSWATAKQWTMQQAADDILTQEAAWKGAAKLIRQYRLQAKEDVKRATALAEIATAMAIWNGFVSSIRNQLGVA